MLMMCSRRLCVVCVRARAASVCHWIGLAGCVHLLVNSAASTLPFASQQRTKSFRSPNTSEPPALDIGSPAYRDSPGRPGDAKADGRVKCDHCGDMFKPEAYNDHLQRCECCGRLSAPPVLQSHRFAPRCATMDLRDTVVCTVLGVIGDRCGASTATPLSFSGTSHDTRTSASTQKSLAVSAPLQAPLHLGRRR